MASTPLRSRVCKGRRLAPTRAAGGYTRHRSGDASRFTAGVAGFLNLSQFAAEQAGMLEHSQPAVVLAVLLEAYPVAALPQDARQRRLAHFKWFPTKIVPSSTHPTEVSGSSGRHAMMCQSWPGLNEPAGPPPAKFMPSMNQIAACRRRLAKECRLAVAIEVAGAFDVPARPWIERANGTPVTAFMPSISQIAAVPSCHSAKGCRPCRRR